MELSTEIFIGNFLLHLVKENNMLVRNRNPFNLILGCFLLYFLLGQGLSAKQLTYPSLDEKRITPILDEKIMIPIPREKIIIPIIPIVCNKTSSLAMTTASSFRYCNIPGNPSSSPIAQNHDVKEPFVVILPSVPSTTSYQLYRSINDGAYLKVATLNTQKNSVSQVINEISQVINVESKVSYKYKACSLDGCSTGYSPNRVINIGRLIDHLPDLPEPVTPAPVPPILVSVPSSPPEPSLESIPSSATSHYYGPIPGSGAVSGGAATYNIPIQLPPGRANMTPSVSLNYSSRSGSGIAGVGWGISASGAISRCPQTFAQDEQSINVTYSASDDRLCLDGQRLMHVAGTYGEANAVYRLEEDTFVSVVQKLGHINYSSTYFEVTYANGNVSYYGKTSNSQVRPAGKNVAQSWMLSTAYDVSKQNNIQYEYTNFDEGETLLSTISYTGNGDGFGDRKVVFNYESREAIRSSYLGGGHISSSQRLSSISTRLANQLIRRYTLSYDISSTSHRDILKSLTACSYKSGRTPKCQLTTEFESHLPNMGWAAAGQAKLVGSGVSNASNKIVLKDVNGDGVSEMLYMTRNDEGYSVDVRVFNENTNEYESTYSNLNDYDTQLYAGIDGDINNDGITDFLINHNGRMAYLQFDSNYTLHLNVLGNYFPEYITNLTLAGTQVIDINNDGYQDIIFTSSHNNGRSEVAYFPNKGVDGVNMQGNVGFDDIQTILVLKKRPAGVATQRASVFDVDGDGLQDIVLTFNNANLSTQLSIAFANKQASGSLNYNEVNASGLNLPSNIHSTQFTWADMNGDGLKDLLRAREYGSGIYAWAVSINKGDGTFNTEYNTQNNTGIHKQFTGPSEVPHIPSYKVQARYGGLRVADVDNDGMDEILVARDTSDNYCIDMAGGILDNFGRYAGDLVLNVCNDALHNYMHENEENSNQVIHEYFGKYDFRRFNWSLIDFKIDNATTQLRERKVTHNALKAPLISTALKGGTTVSGLQLKDYNNDGYLDSIFSTVSGHHSSISLTVGGYRTNNINFYGRFSGSGPATGVYMQQSLLAHDTRLQDSIYEVNNNAGNIIRWEYAPMSRPSLINGRKFYTVPSDREKWYLEKDAAREHIYFTSSMPLVSSQFVSNSKNGFNETRYRYHEAIYNKRGRGFMGFHIIDVEERATSIETTTLFDQIFPKVSAVSSIVTRIDPNHVITTSSSTSSANSKGKDEGVVIQTLKNQYEINAAHQSEFSAHNLHHIYNHKTTKKQFAMSASASTNLINNINTSINIPYDPAIEGTTALLSVLTSTVDPSSIDEWGNVTASNTVKEDEYGIHTTDINSEYSSTSEWRNKPIYTTKTTSYTQKSNNEHAIINQAVNVNKESTVRYNSWDLNHKRKPTSISKFAGGYTTSACNNMGNNTCTTTTTQYNQYGLPTKIDVTGNAVVNSSMAMGVQTRQQLFTYSRGETSYFSSPANDNDGYFLSEHTLFSGTNVNTTAIVSTSFTDPTNGLSVAQKDANDILTLVQFDEFDRPIQRTVPGAPNIFMAYNLPDSDGPEHVYNLARAMVSTQQANYPSTKRYFNNQQQVVREAMQGFNGQYNFTDTKYNLAGHTVAESTPYSQWGTTEPIWTRFSNIDGQGRVEQKTVPSVLMGNDLIITYTYQGTKTRIDTSALSGHNLTMSRWYSTSGQLMSTEDANSGKTKYAYDSIGNPVVITDAKNNSIVANYDDFGRKTWVNDPNQGKTSFVYNAFGELISEKDANNNTIHYQHDHLGRLINRTYPTGVATFVWDTNKVGLLTQESVKTSGQVTHQKQYNYDQLSRLLKTTTTIDSSSYTVTQAYNYLTGQVSGITYPAESGVKLAFDYNSTGYLLREKDNSRDGNIYREITAQDAFGNITASKVANNNLTTQAIYSERTGQMLNIQAKRSDAIIHYWDYPSFDSYGNLLTQVNQRQLGNASTITNETFTYDNLHRLTESKTSNSDFTATIDYAFDVVGNLTKKSDYSVNNNNAYSYVNNTNKLASVLLKNNTTATFGYDAKGNQTHRNNVREVTYNAMNKPTNINRFGSSVNLYYGADNARYKQVRTKSGITTTTHYIDKLYEVETTNGVKKHTSYISDVAILSSEEGLKFTFKDRLGSTTTISDQYGNNLTYRNFDPFGKPRQSNGNLSSTSSYGAVLGQYNDNTTRRGFTDHEHLDEVEFIHMNGRVYDYNLGRFLSVDPFVHEGSQGINPYSYIMNNPLSGTDPTGYAPEKEIEVEDVKTERVATTGSRIKRDQVTQVSGTVTTSNGSRSFTANFKNGSLSSVSTNKIGDPSETEKNISTSGSGGIKYTGAKGTTLNEDSSMVEPNAKELQLVQNKAQEMWDKSQKTGYEYCAIICEDGNGYSMSKMVTNGLRFACDTGSLSCPATSNFVSDIHSHGKDEGVFQINQREADFLGGVWKTGDWSRKPTLDVFSKEDIRFNRDYKINGWLIPATKDNKLLWFNHENRKDTHEEYDY